MSAPTLEFGIGRRARGLKPKRVCMHLRLLRLKRRCKRALRRCRLWCCRLPCGFDARSFSDGYRRRNVPVRGACERT